MDAVATTAVSAGIRGNAPVKDVTFQRQPVRLWEGAWQIWHERGGNSGKNERKICFERRQIRYVTAWNQCGGIGG